MEVAQEQAPERAQEQAPERALQWGLCFCSASGPLMPVQAGHEEQAGRGNERLV